MSWLNGIKINNLFFVFVFCFCFVLFIYFFFCATHKALPHEIYVSVWLPTCFISLIISSAQCEGKICEKKLIHAYALHKDGYGVFHMSRLNSSKINNLSFLRYLRSPVAWNIRIGVTSYVLYRFNYIVCSMRWQNLRKKIIRAYAIDKN